jgi:hypothetical protein
VPEASFLSTQITTHVHAHTHTHTHAHGKTILKSTEDKILPGIAHCKVKECGNPHSEKHKFRHYKTESLSGSKIQAKILKIHKNR